mgnify:CR=1 FL=1
MTIYKEWGDDSCYQLIGIDGMVYDTLDDDYFVERFDDNRFEYDGGNTTLDSEETSWLYIEDKNIMIEMPTEESPAVCLWKDNEDVEKDIDTSGTLVMQYDDFFRSAQFVWMRPDAQPMRASDWQDYVRSFSYLIHAKECDLFFVFNAFDGNIEWNLPKTRRGYHWVEKLNTSLSQVSVQSTKFMMPAWSVLVFEAEKI